MLRIKLWITKQGVEKGVLYVNKITPGSITTPTPHTTKESYQMIHTLRINCELEHARQPDLWQEKAKH